MLLNFQTESLASLLIHHPFRPTGVPHCQGDLETHRHCDIAHPQIICIIVVLKVCVTHMSDGRYQLMVRLVSTIWAVLNANDADMRGISQF